jgi:hypothetical protein
VSDMTINYAVAPPAPAGPLSAPSMDGVTVDPVAANGLAQLVPGAPVVYEVAPPGFAEWTARWLAAIAPTVERKALEYGSNSLARKGYRYANAQHTDVTNVQALELGTVQYLLEKSDRIEDALLRGMAPSTDTVSDSVVYGLMCLFIRDQGHWA